MVGGEPAAVGVEAADTVEVGLGVAVAAGAEVGRGVAVAAAPQATVTNTRESTGTDSQTLGISGFQAYMPSLLAYAKLP